MTWVHDDVLSLFLHIYCRNVYHTFSLKLTDGDFKFANLIHKYLQILEKSSQFAFVSSLEDLLLYWHRLLKNKRMHYFTVDGYSSISLKYGSKK